MLFTGTPAGKVVDAGPAAPLKPFQLPPGKQHAGHLLPFQPSLRLGSPGLLGLYSLKGCY